MNKHIHEKAQSLKTNKVNKREINKINMDSLFFPSILFVRIIAVFSENTIHAQMVDIKYLISEHLHTLSNSESSFLIHRSVIQDKQGLRKEATRTVKLEGREEESRCKA